MEIGQPRQPRQPRELGLVERLQPTIAPATNGAGTI
jgi:hypothetical protein